MWFVWKQFIRSHTIWFMAFEYLPKKIWNNILCVCVAFFLFFLVCVCIFVVGVQIGAMFGARYAPSSHVLVYVAYHGDKQRIRCTCVYTRMYIYNLCVGVKRNDSNTPEKRACECIESDGKWWNTIWRIPGWRTRTNEKFVWWRTR